MLTDKIFIVGDQPGPKTDPNDPLGLDCQSGRNLARHLGMNDRTYQRNTVRINSVDAGTEAFFEKAERCNGLVIFVGKEGARRLKVSEIHLLDWNKPFLFRGCRCILYPHTSASNRVWNDKNFKTKTMLDLRHLVARYAPIAFTIPLAPRLN